MNHLLALLLSLFFSLSLHAINEQRIDSLEQELLHCTSDSLKLHLHRRLAYYWRSVDSEQSLAHSKQIVSLAQSLFDTAGLVSGWRCMAKSFRATQLYDSAVFYYEKPLGCFRNQSSAKAREHTSRAYNDLGWLELKKGNPEGAVDFGFKALEETKNLENSSNRARSLALIGVALRTSVTKVHYLPFPPEAMERLKEATDYLHKALEMTLSQNDVYAASVAMQLANTYGSRSEHETGLKYIDVADSLSRHFNKSKSEEAIIDMNRALMLSDLDRFREALEIFEKRRTFFEQSSDAVVACKYHFNLAEIHQELNAPLEAIAHALKAEQKALLTENLVQLRDCSELLAELYTATGDYKNAAKAWKRRIERTDTLSQSEIRKNMDELVARYESRLKNEEIERLELEAELAQEQAQKQDSRAEQQRQLLYAAFIMLLLMVVLLVAIYQRSKTRQTLAQQRLEAGANELEMLRANLHAELENESPVFAMKADGQNVNEYLMSPLTERELEVLNLLAQGLSNKAISDSLFISPNTAKTHVAHIYEKLDVKNRTQAAQKAGKLKMMKQLGEQLKRQRELIETPSDGILDR